MHYYKRNLGDYAKKAGRLSMLQHGAYTLLMDSCYDREQFPTLEEAIDWAWASSKEEIEAVEFVLKKFFILQDGVYVQPRIKEEVDEYQAKAETNKRIAREREEKRRAKMAKRSDSSTSRARTVDEPSAPEHEPPPNQEPVTSNQEPVTSNQVKDITPQAAKPSAKSKKSELDYSCWPGLPEQQTLEDWFSMRKRIKANVSQTVINHFGKELHRAVTAGFTVDQCLAEAVTRNWRGFKFEWMQGGFNQSTPPPPKKSSVRSLVDVCNEQEQLRHG